MADDTPAPDIPDDRPTPPAKAPRRTAKALPAPPPLPDHKQDLVELAITRGVPSYEAHAMTVDELKQKLEG